KHAVVKAKPAIVPVAKGVNFWIVGFQLLYKPVAVVLYPAEGVAGGALGKTAAHPDVHYLVILRTGKGNVGHRNYAKLSFNDLIVLDSEIIFGIVGQQNVVFGLG